MPTIKDVARQAGVSVATVSRVINNRGYLSAQVRKKVADAMGELDYQPNDLARSLHRRKSDILGLIVPAVSHPFFGEVTRYVEYFAYENGYKLMVCNSLQQREKEREYIEMLKRCQVDGIIMGSHVQEIDDYLGVRLPLLSLDRRLGDTIPYIGCDNYEGGALATRHLLDRGCRRLVHISGSLNIRMLANLRTDACADVCREAGVPMVHYQLPASAVTDFREEAFAESILRENPDCDGVFATSDMTAAAVMAAAQRLGWKVPERLCVAGFDGSLISELVHPRLTTVRQPVEDICRHAVEDLIRMIGGGQPPAGTILPVALLERESTRRPPRAS